MSDCRSFEVSLSSMLDGELEPVDLTPTIDHLIACEACAAFYRQARTLDELVREASVSDATGSAPEQLWQRIRNRREAEVRAPAEVSRSALPRWASTLAASVLLVALGAWGGSALQRTATITPDPLALKADVQPTSGAARGVDNPVVEVVVGRDRESMTDRRFVQLLKELLEADHRYHSKMREVLRVVTEQTLDPEGSVDDRTIDVGGEERAYRVLLEPEGKTEGGRPTSNGSLL